MDLDQIIDSEIKLINNKTESLTQIASLLLEITSVPLSLLNTFYSLIDKIKNDEISEAVSSLEESLIQVNHLTKNLIESIQILQQES
jgi:hypothetical protein